jgi:hypothetical protein
VGELHAVRLISVSRAPSRTHLERTMNRVLLLPVVTLLSCSPMLTPVTARTPQALVARASAPNVIWVVDTSGSLTFPIDPNQPECPAGCGPGQVCPVECVTRRARLLAGMELLTAGLSNDSSQSLVLYPVGFACGAPSTITDGLSSTDVISRVGATPPGGGTPTAAALRFVASLPAPTADTFVVLATDGVPNCNEANPNNLCSMVTPERVAACKCTLSSCATNACALGCLDEFGAATASQQLAEKGYQLMVVGVGADIASSAASFSAMAMALPRTCAADAECTSGKCTDSGECAERLFIATSVADFQRPAQRLATAVKRSSRCSWWLSNDRDVASSEVVVRLGDDLTTDWSLETLPGGQRIVFRAAACERLLSNDSLSPSFTAFAR